MYIIDTLSDFDSKVESSLFPFMASLGYNEFHHSEGDEINAFSKYEFRKGDDCISIYLGLNRLDYNSGIQIRQFSVGKAGRDTKDLTDAYLGYSPEQIDQSMDEIKRCLQKVLSKTD